MLGLVQRTGTEFGIAVIVASHLLGEIERVCDFLVAIDAGHLLRAAPLGSFTERTGYLAVEVEEGETALAEALAARGLQPAVDGRTVVVPIADDHPYDVVRDALADLGLPLVRLEQRRRGLEDLFADAPRRTPTAGGRRRGRRRSGPAGADRERAAMSGSRPPLARTTAATASGPGGSIYDLGYQRYDGPRLGRTAASIALLRNTFRSAFGIGRGGRAKIAPFTLAALAILPAILAVGIAAIALQAGAGDVLEQASPVRYETYHGLTVTLLMLFCAAQAPELFGRDQRYGVLPLYFSRALTRTDYARRAHRRPDARAPPRRPHPAAHPLRGPRPGGERSGHRAHRRSCRPSRGSPPRRS